MTNVKPHECCNDPKWSTTFRLSMRPPNDRSKPAAFTRAPIKALPFDKQLTTGYRASTKASGFVENSTLFDGTGWVPAKNLHSDLIRTEYRMRFNQAKPFHKTNLSMNHGKLPKKHLVYDHRDWC